MASRRRPVSGAAAKARAERNQNLKALGIAALIAAAAIVIALRPAVILPLGRATVEQSLALHYGDGTRLAEKRESILPTCDDSPGGGYDCLVPTPDIESGGGPPVAIKVDVDWAGCWDAVGTGNPSHYADSGCVSIIDY